MAAERKDGTMEEDKAVKIDKWDTSSLKNALDDAAKNVMLETYGFKESHGLMDGRLAICTVAVGFAMFALVWDYLNPFPLSKPVLILCVVSYFVLMGILTLYTNYTERGIFLVARQKDKAGLDPDNTWILASSLKKYDDIYNLRAQFTDGKTNESRNVEISRSVACFFDVDGLLCTDLFDPLVKQLKTSLDSEKKKN